MASAVIICSDGKRVVQFGVKEEPAMDNSDFISFIK
jgi:hypothetical protein